MDHPTPRPIGPIAELTIAIRSPCSLLVGAAVGGAAPALNYYTVHWGHLIEDGRVEWRSPLWLLVGGAFALSSKSVYRWGRQTFGDPWSAAALVAMLEGALLLSPHPLIAQVALAYLTAINATVYGCALALQYQSYQASKAAAAAAAAVVEAAPAPAVAPPRAVLPPPKPVSNSSSSAPKPAPGDLRERAIAAIRGQRVISTEALRTTLQVRRGAAAALLAQLEREGVVGRPDPSDHGRRPVLLDRPSPALRSSSATPSSSACLTT